MFGLLSSTDAESVRSEQEALIDEVYRARCQSGHDLLLKVILPRDAADQNEQYYPQIRNALSTGDPAGLVETAAVKPRSLARNQPAYY